MSLALGLIQGQWGAFCWLQAAFGEASLKGKAGEKAVPRASKGLVHSLFELNGALCSEVFIYEYRVQKEREKKRQQKVLSQEKEGREPDPA